MTTGAIQQYRKMLGTFGLKGALTRSLADMTRHPDFTRSDVARELELLLQIHKAEEEKERADV